VAKRRDRTIETQKRQDARRSNPALAFDYAAYLRKWSAKRRAWLNEFKGKPCIDCGIQYPPHVMDFDHRIGTVKIMNVSLAYRRSKSAVLAEMAKCDLVCSNCHRTRTFNRISRVL
jgi:hypothetical protein